MCYSGQKTCFEYETGVGIDTTKPDLYVRSVCFSPDGQYLVAGAEDKVFKIWDIATRKQLHVFTGHDQDIYAVDYSPDGRFIASGSGDARIKLWYVSNLRAF